MQFCVIGKKPHSNGRALLRGFAVTAVHRIASGEDDQTFSRVNGRWLTFFLRAARKEWQHFGNSQA
jgi:hypothetical protein